MFRGAVLGLLIGVSISFIPICGIRRSTDLVLGEPAQVIFFVEWLIVTPLLAVHYCQSLYSAIHYLQSFPDTVSKPKRLFKQLLMPVSALVFLLLYFAACGLCQRLDMGAVRGETVIVQAFRYTGLLIATAGLGIQAYTLILSSRAKQDSESGNGYMRSPLLKLRHPCFFATLVALTGIPMVMGTWYPLFAIPGIFIVMKWIVAEQERVLVEKFGTPYTEFQTRTKRLLPNLY